MSSESWYYFFSSTAQAFSALVALLAIFIIYRLSSNPSPTETEKAQIKDLMKTSLYFSFIIISLSFILLPLGYVELDNETVLGLWNYWKIKWVAIYFVVGLSIGTLYKIYDSLRKYFLL